MLRTFHPDPADEAKHTTRRGEAFTFHELFMALRIYANLKPSYSYFCAFSVRIINFWEGCSVIFFLRLPPAWFKPALSGAHPALCPPLVLSSVYQSSLSSCKPTRRAKLSWPLTCKFKPSTTRLTREQQLLKASPSPSLSALIHVPTPSRNLIPLAR